ncbi:hypothetical protein BRYFOR_06747 [Marvinbryantia formatexigens DSM 14469]|uniref:Uncharacterized protein n=1 Tax=Marvinbryantia formatexigens DSM 14469 TaxID=478749 RepID=C6LDP9_9FIRM|nr:hypothetical protein BRYFOR_06747 [Marvinbryantia formatexigens DSM 14469]
MKKIVAVFEKTRYTILNGAMKRAVRKLCRHHSWSICCGIFIMKVKRGEYL